MGEGTSGENGESRINIYTLPCVKQIVSKKMLQNTGSPAWNSVMTQRDSMGNRREAREGSDTYLIMADYCCCMAETNTTL